MKQWKKQKWNKNCSLLYASAGKQTRSGLDRKYWSRFIIRNSLNRATDANHERKSRWACLPIFLYLRAHVTIWCQGAYTLTFRVHIHIMGVWCLHHLNVAMLCVCLPADTYSKEQFLFHFWFFSLFHLVSVSRGF